MTDSPIKPLWEDQGPFFRRLYNTWKEMAFHPVRFFANMRTDAGIGKPYLYFLITGFIGTLAKAIWLAPIYLIMFVPMAFTGAGWLPVVFIIGILAAIVLLSPFTLTLMVFILAGIYHLSLMIFGGNKKGFEATFRSLAYAMGSASIGNLIPFLGAYAAGVWSVILTIIGFRTSHQITTGKAVLAYLVPLFLCTCIFTLAIIIPMLIFMSYMMSQAH